MNAPTSIWLVTNASSGSNDDTALAALVACCGEQGRICPLDNIHPNAAGADMIQHAIMESLGRVNVGAGGATNFDVGALPLVAAL